MKLLSIVGARPQFVKAAMVVAAVRRHNRACKPGQRITHQLLHTGQHYDPKMSEVFFEQLPLPKPHFNLAVGSGSHGAQTARMLEGIETILEKGKPDAIIVYGDTNSTVAGALAATKLQICVAHVEAGLRSFNRRMPEELNRVATDHLSDLLFCPTVTAIENLRKEGIVKNVFLNGDVMLDAVLEFRSLADKRVKLLESFNVRRGDYVLATVHRAENTDSIEKLVALFDTLLELQFPVVLPMHPRVRDKLARVPQLKSIQSRLEKSPHIRVSDPASYLDMLMLEQNARVVLTDSGGVQKEAFFLGVPCLTLREETEWVETLKGGWNQVVGSDKVKIVRTVNSIWNRNGSLPTGRPDLKSFGSGKSSDMIVKQIFKNC
jgi:UDP-GlcNAc3NAcA epimerase